MTLTLLNFNFNNGFYVVGDTVKSVFGSGVDIDWFLFRPIFRTAAGSRLGWAGKNWHSTESGFFFYSINPVSVWKFEVIIYQNHHTWQVDNLVQSSVSNCQLIRGMIHRHNTSRHRNVLSTPVFNKIQSSQYKQNTAMLCSGFFSPLEKG